MALSGATGKKMSFEKKHIFALKKKQGQKK